MILTYCPWCLRSYFQFYLVLIIIPRITTGKDKTVGIFLVKEGKFADREM